MEQIMIKVAFEDLEFKQGVKSVLSLSGWKILSDVDVVSKEMELPLTKVEEYYGTQGEYRSSHYSYSDEGKELIDKVNSFYGIDIFKALQIKVIGEEVQSNVITATLTKQTYKELEGSLPVGYVVSAIKFFLNDNTVAIKVYWLPEIMTPEYPELPDGSDLIAWSNYHDFAGYEYPNEFDDYLDVFFMNDDHQAVCDFYDKELPSGLYGGYGIRFNKQTKDIKKIKSYVYNKESIIDWRLTIENARSAKHNINLN